MRACKMLLFIVFTSACMSHLALAEKQDTKDGKGKDGLRVSLGDRTAQVRGVYGEPDKVTRSVAAEVVKGSIGSILKKGLHSGLQRTRLWRLTSEENTVGV